ncbi:hypothetical protein FE697_020635 [Mumia zhuanghuii]|uniref:Metallothionein n=2 Tax=Mumia TaxID=1546255 RepID=A0ABW1QK07_9ACTN|nr:MULTISPECIES: hypothetical protein [Mumia]KAA1418241.1 hypothetical protein FE697_020635 [Mumia zhuanghuii]
MAKKQEFKHQYLTMSISATRRGLEFRPKWGEGCDIDTGCVCTDGCTNCSGECTACSATCKGPDSTGALIPNPQGEVELVLNLKAIAAVLKSVEAKAGG